MQNIESFKPWVEDYNKWFVLGIKIVVADIPYECFSAVSAQSSNLDRSGKILYHLMQMNQKISIK